MSQNHAASSATAPPSCASPQARPPTQGDAWADLRQWTPARIALGRAGNSLPTAEVLRFAAAHAAARDAVHLPLDAQALSDDLRAAGAAPDVILASQATGRDIYLRRPDLGRRLDIASVQRLRRVATASPPDLVLVVADGLSAVAAQAHAPGVIRALLTELHDDFTVDPVIVATQARVALADEIGEILQARLALILLGERPGLSSPDSLGAYLTCAPRLGRLDAQRNCISNIRPAGLAPEAAARRIAWLIREALRRGLTGVALKDDSDTALLAP